MKKCNIKKFTSFLAALVFMIIQPCSAESLIGKVTKDGIPVPGMEIVLSHPDPSVVDNLRPSFTNENGEYSFLKLPKVEDKYNLKFYWAGKLVRTRNIDFSNTSRIITDEF